MAPDDNSNLPSPPPPPPYNAEPMWSVPPAINASSSSVTFLHSLSEKLDTANYLLCCQQIGPVINYITTWLILRLHWNMSWYLIAIWIMSLIPILFRNNLINSFCGFIRHSHTTWLCMSLTFWRNSMPTFTCRLMQKGDSITLTFKALTWRIILFLSFSCIFRLFLVYTRQ